MPIFLLHPHHSLPIKLFDKFSKLFFLLLDDYMHGLDYLEVMDYRKAFSLETSNLHLRSQLDNQLKSVDAKPTTVLKRDEEIGALHKELNETRNEVDRLLKIVQNLEKEKSSLLSKIDDGSPRRLVWIEGWNKKTF